MNDSIPPPVCDPVRAETLAVASHEIHEGRQP